MPEIGQTLSHFKIVEKIGQGGMGEVYLANDTTLDRKVALKFLPEAFTSDPERMARFEREAKLLASLNHPNIAGIYGLEQADGNRFLVLEYVEGETLQARLSKGALPLEDALALCRQIAEGLEAAHEKGVIHRDLKPANVMITAEEKVKILDFGLAKALSDDTQSIDSSQSPTLTEAMTRPGVILGTAAYMSPEQAKGKSVDKRADIWAFGCILYECLTGKKAFEAETVTEMLASVIKEEPDWKVLPIITPQNIHFVLRRCLEKDKKRRFRDAADVLIEIEETRETFEIKGPVKLPWLAWSVAAIFLISFSVVSFLHFGQKSPPAPGLIQFQIPTKLPITLNGLFELSPNGRHLAFSAIDPDGDIGLYIRSLDSLEIRKLLAVPSNLYIPPFFWSPDSRYIVVGFDGKLEKIDVSSSMAQPVTKIPGTAIGGSWNRNDVIIYADYLGSNGIMQVSASGGVPTPLTKPDPEQDERFHFLPSFLPDGRHFLYYCDAGSPEISGVYIGSLDVEPEEQSRRKILDSTTAAVYVPSQGTEPGRLLFMYEQTLLTRRFDENRLEPIGEQKMLMDEVGSYGHRGFFSASLTGIFTFLQSGAVYTQMIWLDREGSELEVVLGLDEYLTFDLSRDGSHLVYTKGPGAGSETNLWVKDLLRGPKERLTAENASHMDPRWSPDGNQVIFESTADPSRSPFLTAFPGSPPVRVFKHEGGQFALDDWSPDGKYLLYHNTRSPELWVRPLEGDQKPEVVARSLTGIADQGQFSPDGRWIAYNSDESGQHQVFVVPFPPKPTVKKKQISVNGGVQPTWKGDGRELYFLTADGTLMATEVMLGETFKYKDPSPLFKKHLRVIYDREQYLPSPDGKRFLFALPSVEDASRSINVILNWPSLTEQ
jgi:serine/threonine protein kinase